MSFRKHKKQKTLNEVGNTGKENFLYKLQSFRKPTFLLLLTLLIFMVAGMAGEKLPSTKPVVEERPTMRVLFIGNSYTYHNNMPLIFENLAQHDPSSHFYIKTDMFVEGGARLLDLWNNPLKNDILTREKWDYVVLQPQSLWAMTDMKFKNNDRALELWAKAIRSIGAKPVFFMTWPRHANSTDYRNPDLPFMGSPMQMYENIARRTAYLTKRHDLMTVPIGDYWFYTTINNLDIPLYDADGSHPSIYGSSLTAMLLYTALVDKTLDDIKYKPNAAKAAQYNEILSLAAQDL